MPERADVVVVGMGVGGETLAGTLAERGLRVVGIERELVGGECPYWGCIPSKMAIRAANVLAEARRVEGMAGRATVIPDWSPVARRIRDEATDSWNDKVAVDRFVGKGGHFVRGEAKVEGPGRVSVDGTTYEASRALVIATGAQPVIPPIPGLDEVDYWTNRQALEAERLPGSLAVLGGGAIGLELAQAYARFGVEVTVIEALDRLLPLEEPEVGELLADVLGREGLVLHVGRKAERVEGAGGRIRVTLDDGAVVEAERLLVSTGRRANLGALGVGNLGLDEGAPFLAVDERMRVEGVEGVWAVGDVVGEGAFTHVAVYQARIAAADILGEPTDVADYKALSRVTFTDPEVGAVGLTEAQARDRGIRVQVGVARVPSSARGWIHKAGNEGLIKLVADADRGVLVGAASVGPHGGEVLGLLNLAVHAEVPIATMRTMIYAYPTFYRAVEDALADLADRAA